MQNFALLVHSESTYFSTQRQPYDWESAQTAPMRIYKSTAEKKDNFKLSIFMLGNRRCDFFPNIWRSSSQNYKMLSDFSCLQAVGAAGQELLGPGRRTWHRAPCGPQQTSPVGPAHPELGPPRGLFAFIQAWGFFLLQ